LTQNVEVVFGLPGDGINGVIEALRKSQDKISFVQVRHEESAAFMACDTPNGPASSACALPPPGPAALTF
jgi:pyruvate dehydrogenase (quinone)